MDPLQTDTLITVYLSCSPGIPGKAYDRSSVLQEVRKQSWMVSTCPIFGSKFLFGKASIDHAED